MTSKELTMASSSIVTNFILIQEFYINKQQTFFPQFLSRDVTRRFRAQAFQTPEVENQNNLFFAKSQPYFTW